MYKKSSRNIPTYITISLITIQLYVCNLKLFSTYTIVSYVAIATIEPVIFEDKISRSSLAFTEL